MSKGWIVFLLLVVAVTGVLSGIAGTQLYYGYKLISKPKVTESSSWVPPIEDLRKAERERHAKELGLPADATDEAIEAAEAKAAERIRIADAERLGLPSTATAEEIQEEDERQEDMKSRGLPATTKAEEAYLAEELLKRADVAESLGLPTHSSWEKIEAKKNFEFRNLAARLGLSPDAPLDVIEVELVRRQPKN